MTPLTKTHRTAPCTRWHLGYAAAVTAALAACSPTERDALEPVSATRSAITPCSAGSDVRNLPTSADVTSAIKDMVYRTPGPIISRFKQDGTPNPKFPSGKVVVLPFETPDFPRNPAITPGTIYSEFFPAGTLTGLTINNYFYENSWGQFQIKNGGISDWVTLSKNLKDYVGFEGDDQVPRDVLKKANINWAALDTNNDKTITPAEAQIVFLVANGYSAATRGFTSWATGSPVALSSLANVTTPNGTFTFLPKVVYIGTKKASDPAYATNPFRIESTICHELGHAFFNLPDRYAAGTCGTGATGQYDMMSNNCSWEHFTIYDKMKIGWIQPPILDAHISQCVTLPASEGSKAALVLAPPPVSASPKNEYFIVENRYKPASGCNGCMLFTPANGVFDTGLPESGLAIWWVQTGGGVNGYDDVRLIDASKGSIDPDGTTPIGGANPGYVNQGLGALYKQDGLNHILVDSTGGWSLLWFTAVSNPGYNVYAQF
jgi:M6 family metalloprotease-like protein